MEIEELRGQIDTIDDKLTELFLQRLVVSEEIGKYKRDRGLPVLDKSRERAVLARRTAELQPPYDGYVRMFYRTLFDISRARQSALTAGESPLAADIAHALENSPRKLPARAAVACQGIEGAYSAIACDKLFPGADITFMDSFEGVARAVRGGLCEYGVLPIENNIHGSVLAVYDLMQHHRFAVARAIKLRVSHSLAAKPGTRLADIKEILSHEQAIGQCREFLAKLPGVKVTMCENTAVAARTAAQPPRGDLAAICSTECGVIYGLELLARDIQDSDNNYTRFLCISKELQILEGASRISIMFRVAHRPGSLYEVLSRFATAGLNITKLESRPIPGHDFEFQFYLDADGDIRDPETAAVICSLADCTEQLIFLGAYPE
ncbi:MAG TPA: prephenate dehydratase domain-containing protein [Candidatus Acidoferrum sp.]|nr:prephenate dehydratase domain-containing protein [Candidatus Acidoferrum sp.]